MGKGGVKIMEELIRTLAVTITNETKLCGSIAATASKAGPRMHNAGYEALGLNFVYMAFGVNDVKGSMMGMKALKIRGLAVSMPHKQEVMKYLDEIDPTASRIGAVNTVVNDDGKLKGYNSDWIGAVTALEERIKLKGKKIILIGAGGAARAIAYGLVHSEAQVFIYNRTADKAERIASDFGITFGGSLEDLTKVTDYDVLVNATSIGSGGAVGLSIVPEAQLLRGKLVMDIVFYPFKTKLLEIAEKAGCETIPGYRMLIHQALFQFEAFTGRKAPFDVMETTLKQALSA